MLQKCCNQHKTQWKSWTQWTFTPLKNTKITTETHKMDVLEALENETLESHSIYRHNGRSRQNGQIVHKVL